MRTLEVTLQTSATVLVDESKRANSVSITASKDNTASIFVGDVANQVQVLAPGDSITISPNKINAVYGYASITGQKVIVTIDGLNVSRGTVAVTSNGSVMKENSSVALLGAGEVFTGEAKDLLDFAHVTVFARSDVASAINGLSVEWSTDGINWDESDAFTIPANDGKTFTFGPPTRYVRVVYTNGASPQSMFRLQSICKSVTSKGSSHKIGEAIITEDDAELVKAVLSGEDPNGTFRNVNTTVDGDLTISDNSSGLAIAEDLVTGKTFIHKFGNAPDFDAADNEITVWDGANNGLFAGSPPASYTYSTIADIGTISSSDAGDDQTLEILGLDTNYALVTQTKTLDGQNDVLLDTVLLRVFRVTNIGSTDIAGIVYLRVNGSGQASGVPSVANTVRAIINDGNNQTEMAIYTVPAGKTGFMRSWFASTAGANKNSNYIIKLKARPFGQVFQLKHRSAVSDIGTSEHDHDYGEPEKFLEKTDLEMRTQMTASGGSAASISAGFDVVIKDN